MNTFLFHDYETFDLDTKRARVSQYASIRTDEDLNIIPGEEKVLYCLPQIDYLPSPEACLVTGITPLEIIEKSKIKDPSYEVLCEYDFFTKINQEFSSPSTISLGYNSTRYDDEISRNGFYRNLLPIYDREWKDNCSRWDILPLTRMYAFLYPNDINIPTDDEGNPSFRLEKLSVANGFKIENEGEAGANFHDALTDVRATIYMAKMMKDTHPEFWEYFLNNKNKNQVKNNLVTSIGRIAFCNSTYFGSDAKYTEPCFLIGFSKANANNFFTIKLSNIDTIRTFMSLTAEEIQSKLYIKKDNPDYIDLPIHQIEINKTSPIIPFDKLNLLFGDTDVSNKLTELGKDPVKIKEAYAYVKTNLSEIENKLNQVFNKGFENQQTNDPELAIYGGFAPRSDDRKVFNFHKDLASKSFVQYFEKNMFEDKRYNELARRIILRNFMDDIKQMPLMSNIVDEWYKIATYKIHKGYDPRINDSQNPEILLSHTLPSLKEKIPEMEKTLDDRGISIMAKIKEGINLQYKELRENGGLEQSQANRKTPKP